MQRIRLEPFTLSDLQNQSRISSTLDILRDTKVTQHLLWKDINTLEKATNWIKDRVEEDAKTFWIILKDTNHIIGFCGIIPCDDQEVRTQLSLNPERKISEVAFILEQNSWNKGYATETAKLLCSDCFMSNDNVIVLAYVEDDNKASIKVLEKVGMKFCFSLSKNPHKMVFVQKLEDWKLMCKKD